jgi:DNA polymerase-3 subunit gamma/tau
MAYQVLARKWRPQNFIQMVGQEHVLKALINALESQRLHHAYLFTGTRGVGKTTIGRILAKCLSCHSGITSTPCGTCGACVSIAEGRYVDLIEIDAASRTKVEDMRELLDNVQYSPSEGRFKIYLIDEVHMLSQSSFNALLKTLEEPPEHVKFLFATTDPQKLPVTILSRCLQFNLKNMSPERIVSHLKNVLTQEQVQFEDMALWALARAADGSMRDALSLTDQAIAYGNQVLSESGVSTMLGTVDQKKIYKILDSLVHRNAALMLNEMSALAEFSPNYASVLASLAEILHRVAIEQAVPGASDNSMGDQEQVMAYARQLCAEDVQLFYQIALVSRQDLAITPDPKSGVEMALLRMLAFQLSPVLDHDKDSLPIETVDTDTHAVVESVPQAVSESPAPEPSVQPVSDAQQISGSPVQNHGDLTEEAKKKTTLIECDDLASTVPVDSVPQEQVVTLSDQIENAVDTNTVSASEIPANESTIDNISDHDNPDVLVSSDCLSEKPSIADVPAVRHPEVNSSGNDGPIAANTGAEDNRIAQGWNKKVTELGLSGMTLNLLLNAFLDESNEPLKLHFESGHFRLLNRNHETRIKEALLQNITGANAVVVIDGLNPGHETPMMWRERMRADMFDNAKQNISADPYVVKILSEFDGILIEESILSKGEIV